MREENDNLTKALAFLEKQLEMTVSKYFPLKPLFNHWSVHQTIYSHNALYIVEKDQLNALHLDFKNHYNSMVQENAQMKKRLAEEIHARKELEIS